MSYNNPTPTLTSDQRGRMRRFVADLRGGQYRQGREKLRYDDEIGGTRLCCLGVACEAAASLGAPVAWSPADKEYVTWDPALPETEESKDRHHFFNGFAEVDTEAGLLPHPIDEFFGIHGSDGQVLVRCDTVWLEDREDPCQHGANPGTCCAVERWISATELNDEIGWGFDQIADAFEYTYLREDWDAKTKNRS